MANLQLINELSKKKKISQKDFCECVGLTDVSLRRIIERNSTKTETLEKIAQILNVPIGYFFGEQPGIVISGEHNQVHNGQGNQIMSSQEKEIEHLRELLAEKERLIQVLLSSKNPNT